MKLMSSVSLFFLICGSSLLFNGCNSSTSSPASPSSTAVTPKVRAQQLMMEAWSEESKVTPLLKSLESQYTIVAARSNTT